MVVGAFSVIVQPVVEPMEHYTALVLGQAPAVLGAVVGARPGARAAQLHPLPLPRLQGAAGDVVGGGVQHHLVTSHHLHQGPGLPAASHHHEGSLLELCSAPSVPQQVVQSRRRPLLGPSPG